MKVSGQEGRKEEENSTYSIKKQAYMTPLFLAMSIFNSGAIFCKCYRAPSDRQRIIYKEDKKRVDGVCLCLYE